MIRINLLQVERAATARRRPAFSFGSAAQKVPLLCSLVLVAAVLYVGYDAWALHQRGQRLQHELAQAREEERKLQPVLKQVEQFEARKTQLQQRVTLIEELRRGQAAAVHLLDEVSKSVPDRLWLTAMKQGADGVQLDGQTNTLTALADFIGNLEGTGYFRRPVEIINSAEKKVGDFDLIEFSMRAQFVMPGQKDASPKEPARAGAAAATVARR